MKVITEGHKYEVSNVENPQLAGQVIQFIEKAPMVEGSTTLKTINNGTSNEEVLAMLIDRIKHLQGKFPCKENAMTITKLEESLMWLEKRTADRVKRNVERSNVK